MTPEDLLKRMAEAYATARTYEDTGVLESVIVKKNERRSRKQSFSTAFERPLWFRFNYDDEVLGPSRILCRNEADAKLHLGKKGERTLPLRRAIASMTGVSEGSAHRVPRMLLPEVIQGTSTADLDSPTLDGVEDVEGFRCHSLSGRFGRHEETLWIDAQSFLLRRIFARMDFREEDHRRLAEVMSRLDKSLPTSFEDFIGETITTYRPLKDAPVLRDVFDP